LLGKNIDKVAGYYWLIYHLGAQHHTKLNYQLSQLYLLKMLRFCLSVPFCFDSYCRNRTENEKKWERIQPDSNQSIAQCVPALALVARPRLCQHPFLIVLPKINQTAGFVYHQQFKQEDSWQY